MHFRFAHLVRSILFEVVFWICSEFALISVFWSGWCLYRWEQKIQVGINLQLVRINIILLQILLLTKIENDLTERELKRDTHPGLCFDSVWFHFAQFNII